MKPKSEAEILVANTSAVFSDKGSKFRIVKGRTTARRGARVLRGREHLFSPIVVDFDTEEAKEDDQPKRGPGRPRKNPEVVEAKAVEPKAEAKAMEIKPQPKTGITTASVPRP